MTMGITIIGDGSKMISTIIGIIMDVTIKDVTIATITGATTVTSKNVTIMQKNIYVVSYVNPDRNCASSNGKSGTTIANGIMSVPPIQILLSSSVCRTLSSNLTGDNFQHFSTH